MSPGVCGGGGLLPKRVSPVKGGSSCLRVALIFKVLAVFGV